MQANTPDGILYLTILEDDKKPFHMIGIIGKANTSVQSWCQSLCSMISARLLNDEHLMDIVTDLGYNSTGNSRKSLHHGRMVDCKSAAEGFSMCILAYLDIRKKKYNSKLGFWRK